MRKERIIFAQHESKQVEALWLKYPENTPLDGWCVTTDGGEIKLVAYNEGKGWADDRDILEFIQVDVNMTPYLEAKSK